MRLRHLSALCILAVLACGSESAPATAPAPAPFRLSSFESSITTSAPVNAEFVISVFRDAGFTIPLQVELRGVPRQSAVVITPGTVEAADGFFVVRIAGAIASGTYHIEVAVKGTGVTTVVLPITLTVQ